MSMTHSSDLGATPYSLSAVLEFPDGFRELERQRYITTTGTLSPEVPIVTNIIYYQLSSTYRFPDIMNERSGLKTVGRNAYRAKRF